VRTAVSIGIHGRTSAEVVRALAPRVEALGFHALWINDVPGGDSLAGLRAAADVTSTLGLATGIVPLDRRPVAELPLDGLPAERTTLGIGSGGAKRPLGLVEAGLDTLRSRTGAQLVVGALGPKMRRLAAERADGVLLNWLTPGPAAEAARELRVAANGRPARSILYVRTVTDDVARPALEEEAAGYARVPAYAANFDRLGIRPIEATLDLTAASGDPGDPGAAARLVAYDVVDELVLRAITPGGTLEELVRFAESAARVRMNA
jgi:alkanesulfonate monooxygenase SsuD/methylene tetrahydromethanopterin reductase-like flavin-dependent oxidoreductase (luciferase family)